MAKLMTVCILEGYSASVGGSRKWSDFLQLTLHGSIEKTKNANKVTYEECWTGTKIELLRSGNEVTSLEIRGWTWKNGQKVFAKIVDVDFTDERPKLAKFENIFESFNINSEGIDILDPFDGFRGEFITKDRYVFENPDIGAFLCGTELDDIFRLNDGYHNIKASYGNDVINGGNGFVSVSYFEKDGNIVFKKAGASVKVKKKDGDTDKLKKVEMVTGTEQNDNMKIGLSNANTQLYGGSGNDQIGGRKGHDLLDGGLGNDKIWGRDGNDLLLGGAGTDELFGGNGNDILGGDTAFTNFGNLEGDMLTGGGGSDLFLISAVLAFSTGAPTEIMDFKDGTDKLGIPGFVGTNIVMDFNDLSFSQSGKHTLIDANGRNIAILRNVDADDIGREDFLNVVDVNAFHAIDVFDMIL